MFAIGLRMLKDKAKSLLIYSLAAIGFVEMYVVLFPTIKSQAAEFDKLIEIFPPEMFSAFNMDASAFSFSSFESFMSTEYMSFLWPILAIVFAISMANYIAIREIDKRTIETLCSLPISRLKIFISRYITGAKILAIFTIVSMLVAVPLAMIHGVDFKIENFITATVGSLLFILAVFSLTTLVSVLSSDKGRSNMIVSGMILVMYVFNIIAGLKVELENLKYVSLFNYFNGTELLADNILTQESILVLGGFIILSTIIAGVGFSKRDLSI